MLLWRRKAKVQSWRVPCGRFLVWGLMIAQVILNVKGTEGMFPDLSQEFFLFACSLVELRFGCWLETGWRHYFLLYRC
jgi:hypothetical protein